MDIQSFINALGASGRIERAKYHLTLGKLIDILDKINPEILVVCDDGDGIGNEGSYRGYYADLALSRGVPMNAECLNKQLKAAAGSTYEGYKGGDFNMGLDTPLWRAEYGNCGLAIVGSEMRDGKLVLITKDVD